MKYKFLKLLGLSSVIVLLIAANYPKDKYFEIAKNLDIFATLFKEVNKYYVDEVDPTELVNVGIYSMLSKLDPYTNYIPEEQVEDYRTLTTGEYGGIGAVIGIKNNKVVVVMPNEGFAAHKAGINVGDEIISIDNNEVQGLSIPEISRLLKGKEGTKVAVAVKKPASESVVTVEMLRERIHVKNVPYYGKVTDKIGFIQLTDFTQNASLEVKNALQELKNDGVESIILDLRGNPGGLLSEAINISNLFLPRGAEVVSTKGKIEEWNKQHKALNNPVDLDIPIVVLVSGSSASAAEIVSGVIQDYDRGVLIGKRTFGKGLVQATRPLAYNAKLKVTVAKYYIPSGRCIQAIDYSKRDEDGYVEKLPDSLRVAFKTKGGRLVFDGGGVDPDIKTSRDPYAPITRSLIQKGFIFDYANDYKVKHTSIPSSDDFDISDEEYTKFVSWLAGKDYDYTSHVEQVLTDLEENAKSEKYFEDIESQIVQLEKKIRHNKDNDLQKFSDEIKEVLEEEICARYYLHKGMVESSFDDDVDVKAAIDVLSDQERYKKILSGEKI
ncbi:S41 family peptidase [Chondrinema litorale]|uniref:S41 family peptidase n=1 Tax=Chondrinema litorale TaxID=2994555 RepID=UPI0025435D03|nr:S41 family peptidase [Chondrinema litorale]UZR92427.1 S41 family peptidase [Chondrinema litorale]